MKTPPRVNRNESFFTITYVHITSKTGEPAFTHSIVDCQSQNRYPDSRKIFRQNKGHPNCSPRSECYVGVWYQMVCNRQTVNGWDSNTIGVNSGTKSGYSSLNGHVPYMQMIQIFVRQPGMAVCLYNSMENSTSLSKRASVSKNSLYVKSCIYY